MKISLKVIKNCFHNFVCKRKSGSNRLKILLIGVFLLISFSLEVQAKTYKCTICADEGWTKCDNAYVTKGDMITVRAFGKWSTKPSYGKFGPAGRATPWCEYYVIVPDCTCGALIMDIGGSREAVCYEENGISVRAWTSGPLRFRMNDTGTHDNSGCLEVEVEIK
jgi:hypothetical protein